MIKVYCMKTALKTKAGLYIHYFMWAFKIIVNSYVLDCVYPHSLKRILWSLKASQFSLTMFSNRTGT